MTLSIWRYSHLCMAVLSCVFLLIASITGGILAFESFSNKAKYYDYGIANTDNITITELISNLNDKNAQIIELKKDANDFVSVEVLSNNGNLMSYYINPITGNKIGEIIPKKDIYKFAKNLHRSLYLKKMGRVIIGITSFLLVLLTLSGSVLLIKKQKNILHFFTKTINYKSANYYHTLAGKWSLIPILIVAITGVYLSMDRFGNIPKNNSNPINIDQLIQNTPIFNSLTIKDVENIQFPFSKKSTDYYHVTTTNQELWINQETGQIHKKRNRNINEIIKQLSTLLHTGQGTIIWSILLLLSCFSIIVFLYTGCYITIKRMGNTTNLKQSISDKDSSEFIILVGSETGSTYKFVTLLLNALQKSGKIVFVSELNQYTTYKSAKHIIILTATYGVGEAPENAKKFIKRLSTITPINSLYYSVVGFGSTAYPLYCQFAIEIEDILYNHPMYKQALSLFKINEQNIESFNQWTSLLEDKLKLSISLNKNDMNLFMKDKVHLKITGKTNLNKDDIFILRLQNIEKTLFHSGDLLIVYPENNIERYYSIARINNEIVLSIKKYTNGKGSSYLYDLDVNTVISCTIKRNPNFHFPKNKNVIMIANGTGIAPFLGMLAENNSYNITHLLVGFKTHNSLQHYSSYLDLYLTNRKLTSYEVAYSNQNGKKEYVQNLIINQSELIINVLCNQGVIMICGSITMQREVISLLRVIVETAMKISIESLFENKQIRTDCY